MGTIDFQTINAAALASYPSLLEQWAPGGKTTGGEYKATNPTRSDSKPGSFAININSGKWGDFATGDKGGDPVSLFAYLNGLEQGEAAKKLSDTMGTGYALDYAKNQESVKKAPPVEWVQVVPVPDDAPAPPEKHYRLGKPDASWTYRDGNGRVIGYVARFDLEDGGKEVMPLGYYQRKDGTGGGQWKWKGFDCQRPMYGLDLLTKNPEHHVVIVEGEKCADALQDALVGKAVVVSWPGGSKAVDKVDWSPLHGRTCVFWPDFDSKKYPDRHELAGQLMVWKDQPGPSAMLKIIDTVREHVPAARIIPHDPSVRPDGWDCADAALEGWDEKQFFEFIKAENVDALAPIETTTPPVAEEAPPMPEEAPPITDDMQPYTDDDVQQDADSFDQTQYVDANGGDDSLTSLKSCFSLLGHDHGSYFFWSKGSRQVVELTAPEMSKSNLRRLAKDQAWQKSFPGKNGPSWDEIQVALIELSHKSGIYSPKRIRGCGAWEDEGRSVLHLGNHLVVDGKQTGIEHHTTEFIYEASPPMNTGDMVKPLDVATAVKLLDLCKMLSWDKPISATLLAGWCVVAPICGALEWRPHIWTTGPAGSGKSWVVENVLALAVGPIALQVQSNTTEAGLRQSLKYDARPVIFDEAEGEDRTAQKRIQNVMELMRQASTETGAEIIKGSAKGRAQSFRIRSCFAFSSIGVNLSQKADISRVTVLSLVKNTSPNASEEFTEIQKFWANNLNPDFCRGLRARAVNLVPVIRKNASIFGRAAAEHLGNQRSGDQVGALLAGAYALHSGKEITKEGAMAWVKDQDWGEVVPEDDGQDEQRCLAKILEYVLRVTGKRNAVDLSIAELINIVAIDVATSGVGTDEARTTLARFGIMVKQTETPQVVIFSNNRGGIAEALKDSPWPKGWGRILSRLPDAEKTCATRFGPGTVSRGVSVPLWSVI